MDNINITSGKQYGQVLVNTLKELEMELPLQERMDDNLFKMWCEEVNISAKKSYTDYIIGKRDDFYLDDNEIQNCLDVAGLQYTTFLLDGLVEKGMVDSYVDENGEKVYKISEFAKEYLKSINN